jgi:hypothetical protein
MVAADGHGGFFIADTLNDRIRHVGRGGRIRTAAAPASAASAGTRDRP